MIVAIFDQSLGAIKPQDCGNASGFVKKFGNPSLRYISKGFPIDNRLFRQGISTSSQWKLHIVHESSSCTSVINQVSSTLGDTVNFNDNTPD